MTVFFFILGPNGQRGLEFTKWEVSDDHDLVVNKTCCVQLRIKIAHGLDQELRGSYLNTALLPKGNKERKLEFLDHTCGKFKIKVNNEFL